MKLECETEFSGSLLKLVLTAEQVDELHQNLSQTFATGGAGAELRLVLPRNWTLFWKIKAGTSKLQLARPQAGEWVASLNLAQQHAQATLSALQNLRTASRSEKVSLSSLGELAWGTNFDLVIERS